MCLVAIVRILSLTTWYLKPASSSTTMSMTQAIRPVRKPIRPQTTQRLISTQRKPYEYNKRRHRKKQGVTTPVKKYFSLIYLILKAIPTVQYLPCDSSSSPPPETTGSQCYHSPDSGIIHMYEKISSISQ